MSAAAKRRLAGCASWRAVLLGGLIAVFGVVLSLLFLLRFAEPTRFTLGDLEVLALNDAVRGVPSGEGLEVAGNAVVEIEVLSPVPLAEVHLHFDSRAPARLELEGGVVGNILFQPDRSVSFQVYLVKNRSRRDGLFGKRVQVYPLRFYFPDGPTEPIALTLTGTPLESAP